MTPDILKILAEVTQKAIAEAIQPLQKTIEQQQDTIKALQDAQNLRVIDFEMSVEGNQLKTVVTLTDGSECDTVVDLPMMAYMGVFDAQKQYQKGELVTHGGSMWHCKQATSDKPDAGTGAWQLCVKKGRDAK